MKSKKILKIVCTLILSNALSFPSVAGIKPISPEQCEKMKTQGVITDKNPVPCERLRTVSFPLINFAGGEDKGQVVVLDVVAERTQIIFNTLYKQKFPINKALLMETYNGDDNASMNDNNTSAFNGRPITGGSDWSLHAYGVAIDINPLQNPYISFDEQGHVGILPALADKQSINRLNYRPKKDFRAGMAEEAIDIFAENGFISWGGYWNYPIDYQHFEVGSRKFVQQLINLSPCKAQRVFNQYAKSYADCMAKSSVCPHAAARAACVAKIIQ
ncbi:M15 family metallopeptidase [Rickettsiella endosymbiont of Miltochrista miniata]|uniref:M15 family metallopeptidase n=1 Tax=Rickettsiella endosymbiont of Miltochrista miniata TaxID=3066239 RepID=UPI00313B3F65